MDDPAFWKMCLFPLLRAFQCDRNIKNLGANITIFPPHMLALQKKLVLFFFLTQKDLQGHALDSQLFNSLAVSSATALNIG